jgi:hypothetical protein
LVGFVAGLSGLEDDADHEEGDAEPLPEVEFHVFPPGESLRLRWTLTEMEEEGKGIRASSSS